MLKKIAYPMIAVALAAGTALATVQPAEARGGRVAAGVAAGIIGLGILGAYAHARDRAYYAGRCYEVGGGCYWREGRCYINRFGDEVCRRSYRVCEPVRTVCD
jgi:hypothetical protein